MDANPAIVTYWFISTPNPGAVLAAEPKADRGFGRKYLAQMNPAWPITPIGSFPLNRSSQVSTGEFYIAGFPGVTLVQTWVEDLGKLSELKDKILSSLPAPDVFVVARGDGSDYGGFAHYRRGEVKRALSGTRTRLIEDIGLPEPFEAPFWAGETAEQLGGLSLPFRPKDIATAAEKAWVGVDVSPTGPDIQVVGYAVDGRPEPKLDRRPGKEESDARNDEGPLTYDDYEVKPSQREGEKIVRLAESAGRTMARVGRRLRRKASSLKSTVDDKLRHTDRP